VFAVDIVILILLTQLSPELNGLVYLLYYLCVVVIVVVVVGTE
jgi:hypothetical protein